MKRADLTTLDVLRAIEEHGQVERYGEYRNAVLEAVREFHECSTTDVLAHLPNVEEGTVRVNLARLVDSGDIRRIRRGLYAAN